MIYRILRRLRLNKLAYSALRRFSKTEYVKQSPQESFDILNSVYRDAGKSCITKSPVANAGANADYDLDIIIPAYNVEDYVSECIDSALNQETRFKFRVIIVEDGATDSTAQVVDRYADNEKCLVIHQENKGLSGARNKALELCKSSYVMFLDSDDLLADGAVEKLMSIAVENDADIVEGAYLNFYQNSGFEQVYPQKAGALNPFDDLKGHACKKVIKRDLLSGICFPEGYWYEDSVMSQIVYPRAQRCYGISDVVYRRRSNPNGITLGTKGKPKRIDAVWVTLRLLDDAKELGINFNQDYFVYMLNQTALVFSRLQGLSDEVQKAGFNLMCEVINTQFKGFVAPEAQAEAEKLIREKDFGKFRLYCLLKH